MDEAYCFSITAAPKVKPPPKAVNPTRCPLGRLGMSSWSAMGIVFEDVFPYLAIWLNIFSEGQ